MLARQGWEFPSAVGQVMGYPGGYRYGSVNGTGNDNGPTTGCHPIVRERTYRDTPSARTAPAPEPARTSAGESLEQVCDRRRLRQRIRTRDPRRRRRRHAARHRRLPLQQRRDRRAAAAPGPRRPAAARLGAPGSRGLPPDLPARPSPRSSATAASTRPTSSASASTSRPARCCPSPPTARPSPSCPSCARTRTRGSSSGSTTPPSPRPTGSTRPRARLGEAWLPTYGGKISSEWFFSKALQILDEAPDVYAARRPPDRGGRLGRVAAHRRRDAQRRRPPATRRCGRSATASPSGTYFEALDPRLADVVDDKMTRDIAVDGRRVPAASPTRRPPGPGCGRAPRSRSPTSTRTSPSRPRPCIEPGRMVADHGHQHLPHGPRAGRAPGARDLRLRRGRHPARATSATRPARAASATTSRGSSSTPSRSATTTEARERGIDIHALLQEQASRLKPGRVRPARARLVERQPLGPRRRGARRAAHRRDAGDDGARDLPRARRGDRLSAPA